jgi:hypothetical protein
MRKVFPRTHLEPARNIAAALEYVEKEDSRELGPWEMGVQPRMGQRTDLTATLSVIQSHTSWNAVVNDASICDVIASRMNWAQAVFLARPAEVELLPELRPWQQVLFDELAGAPDRRKVIWYVDEEGAMGKTVLAKHLIGECDAFYSSGGKVADIAHAYQGQRIVLFDLTRSMVEHVNYQVMESLKNGIIFSPKYASALKTNPVPHLVVFSNFPPDKTKLSQDRWDVRHLRGIHQQPVREAGGLEYPVA